MGRRSATRWAAVTIVVLICVLTSPAAFAAGAPRLDTHCPLIFWWCWHVPGPSPTPGGTAQLLDATPSPSPDPTAAASPSPSAAPATPPASASPPASPSTSPSPGPSATPSPTPTPVPTRSALPAPTNAVAVLSSDSIQIGGLRAIAVRTVTTSAGSVKVIELRADSTTITGLSLQGPCVGGIHVDTAAPRDSASGGLVLDATALQATILGIPIIIAAADLPEGALTLPGITLPPLPTDLALLSVKLFVLSIQSGAMALER